MLNVMFTSRPSARWLAESKIPTNMTIVEVLLVRRTLAWITGIILIIATLLGVSLSYSQRRKMGNKNEHSGRGPFCLSCFDLGQTCKTKDENYYTDSTGNIFIDLTDVGKRCECEVKIKKLNKLSEISLIKMSFVHGAMKTMFGFSNICYN